MYSFKRRMESVSHKDNIPPNQIVDPFYGEIDSGKFNTSTISNNNGKIDYCKLLVLILTWYISAIVTITTSKEIMIQAQLPYMLCFAQFLCATIFSNLYLWTMTPVKPIPHDAKAKVYQVSATYTLGFVFTNIAFSLATPASVETVKAGEPLSTVLIGLIFMREVYGQGTYLSLLPICGGVALACYNNDSFQPYGFFLAIASNFCFSARAVYTKMLNSTSSVPIDDITLFSAISMKGLIFLAPVALLMEGSQLWEYLCTGSRAHTSVYAMLLLIALNGATFAAYNLASYMVLRQTELVTHSVLNVFRRVFIIAFTSVYFQLPMSMVAAAGVGLASVGVLVFSSVRRMEGKQQRL